MKRGQKKLAVAVQGILAASAVVLLASGTAHAQAKKAPAAGAAEKVHCYGVNSCKGKGECGGKGHSCAGKNTCKGQGVLKMTKEDCTKANGKLTETETPEKK